MEGMVTLQGVKGKRGKEARVEVGKEKTSKASRVYLTSKKRSTNYDIWIGTDECRITSVLTRLSTSKIRLEKV